MSNHTLRVAASNTATAPGTLPTPGIEIPDASVDALLAFDPDGDDPTVFAADVARPILEHELRALAAEIEADPLRFFGGKRAAALLTARADQHAHAATAVTS